MHRTGPSRWLRGAPSAACAAAAAGGSAEGTLARAASKRGLTEQLAEAGLKAGQGIVWSDEMRAGLRGRGWIREALKALPEAIQVSQP